MNEQSVQWNGRTFSQLTPEEQRAAVRIAAAQLEAELNAADERLGVALEAATELEIWQQCGQRADFASAAEHGRDCSAHGEDRYSYSYCDQEHPGSDQEARQWHERYHCR